jgi:hypothetical protein
VAAAFATYVPCFPIVEAGEPVARAARGRDGYLREELALPHRGHVDADEELVRGDRALARLPADREGRVEREKERRQVVRRVCDADVAADRATVPYLHVADRRATSARIGARLDLGGADELRVGDHGADLEQAVRGEADRARSSRSARSTRTSGAAPSPS